MPRSLRASVEPHYIDGNGHMNVAWYVHLFDRASWSFIAGFGLDEVSLRASNAGLFAVEQHLHYLSELHEGDALEVHTRLVDVGRKSLRLSHVMTDPKRGVVAATADLVGLHIDWTTRKTRPFPDQLRQRLAAEVESHFGRGLIEEAVARAAAARGG